MYQPKIFEETDIEKITSLIQENALTTLVVSSNKKEKL
jgi:predicted FMN-binding regulatory protein PaiB